MLTHRIVGNTGVQFLGKGLLLLLSMVTFSLLTRHLGPELYGRYNLVLTVFGMAGIVSELGIGTIAIRELAAQREAVERIFPALIAVRLVLAGAAMLVAIAIAWALGYDGDLVELIGVYSIVFVLRAVGSGAYGLISAAALVAWKNVVADMVEGLLFAVLVAIGVAMQQSIFWFVLGGVASVLVGTIVLILLTRRAVPRHGQVDWRYGFRLAREAAPIAIAGLFSVVYFRVDALMLSAMRGEAAVGIYGAAYKYVESAGLAGTILISTLFPVLAYSFEHDRAKLASYYRHALDWIGAFAFSLAVFLFVFADILVSALNGGAFQDSVPVLRILCGAIVLMFVNNAGIHLLFAARQQSHLVWINLIAAAAKIAVNFVVIPRYGAMGAAVATVLTEMSITIAVFATIRRLHGLPSPIAPLGKLSFVALAVIAGLALLHPDLAQRMMLLAGWAVALLVIGVPKPRHLLQLLQTMRAS